MQSLSATACHNDVCDERETLKSDYNNETKVSTVTSVIQTVN